MRVFFSVLLQNEVLNKISQVQQNLKTKASKGSYCPQENFHITLAFLGEVDVEDIQILQQVMEKVEFEPFELSMNSCDYFSTRDGKLVYLKVDDCKPLINLQKSLAKQLRNEGFFLPNKKFEPHITIGRRVLIEKESIQSIEPIEIHEKVNSFSLMLSEQINGKRIYTILDTRKASKS